MQLMLGWVLATRDPGRLVWNVAADLPLGCSVLMLRNRRTGIAKVEPVLMGTCDARTWSRGVDGRWKQSVRCGQGWRRSAAPFARSQDRQRLGNWETGRREDGDTGQKWARRTARGGVQCNAGQRGLRGGCEGAARALRGCWSERSGWAAEGGRDGSRQLGWWWWRSRSRCGARPSRAKGSEAVLSGRARQWKIVGGGW